MAKDWSKERSATEMARENIYAQKEEAAKQAALISKNTLEQENADVQDYLSRLRGMVLGLRHWELHGLDNHYRADVIEMVRSVEGQLERYSIHMQKQLKHYED